MAGPVPAARSDSPGWMTWLTFTVLFLMFVLTSWVFIFASGHESQFLYHVVAATIVAALLLPAWAIYFLSRHEEQAAE